MSLIKTIPFETKSMTEKAGVKISEKFEEMKKIAPKVVQKIVLKITQKIILKQDGMFS